MITNHPEGIKDQKRNEDCYQTDDKFEAANVLERMKPGMRKVISIDQSLYKMLEQGKNQITKQIYQTPVNHTIDI